MVQFKNLKSGHKKGALEKPGKTQPKKPQLQFASSDEDDDTSEEELEIDAEDAFEDEDEGAEDLEGEDGFEDEDMMDGEDELEDEDEDGAEEAEEESDLSEESDEDTGPLTKTPVKGGLLKGLQQTSAKGKAAQVTPKPAMNGHGDADNKKTPKSALKGAKPEPTISAKSKKNVDFNAVPSPAPTKTPSTPHPSSAKAKANNAPTLKAAKVEESTPQSKKGLKKQAASETGGVKRKAVDNDSPGGVPVAKQAKLETEIMNEEKRRRDERNKRTLFLKHIGKQIRKLSDLKALHPDVVSVRSVGLNAWLIFPTETSCNKAYEQLSKANVKGQSVNVDFCGGKSKNDHKNRVNERPINKKAIMIQGLPNDITAEKLKIIFPTSKDIDIPDSKKKKRKNLSRLAFVKFANEQEARAAFKKGETLKIGGEPVEVLFARERKEAD